jgi:antitoxin component of MazEF toxin-antitoxin module
MIKTLTKIGNSQGLIFDAALMDLARLKAGDQVNIEVHDGGTLTLTPVRKLIEPQPAAKAAKRIIAKNSEIFRRLS